ncbi:hypothetical protein ABVK25_008701 [Lepraria finkii]|uniref:Uncharacterized protein n=1 Tax=Lepraria finkii TaxID=1340010 RepID=A0ABR4B1L5_9LECA
MVLLNSLRQQVTLRASRPSVCTQCLYNPKSQRRRLHRVPQLTHDETFAQQGVGKMLEPKSYMIAWRDYQGYLVDRLNRLTADTKDFTRPTKDIALEYSRSPTHASLFNHASMAWNNHSFFSTLSPPPSPISPPPNVQALHLLLQHRVLPRHLPRNSKCHVRPRFRLARKTRQLQFQYPPTPLSSPS